MIYQLTENKFLVVEEKDGKIRRKVTNDPAPIEQQWASGDYSEPGLLT